MAYTTINKSTDYFNTLLWQGNGNNARALTGVGFQPDFTWIKDRTDTESHCLTDAVRGATKSLRSNDTNAEATDTDALQSFNSDGFTVGNQGQVNKSNGDYYVGWNWKANGQGSSNTDGSINTTYTSVNTTAGFSISKYTGTGSNATVGHGLGAAPKMVIIKKTSGADDWKVYHASVGATKSLVLQGNNAETSDSTSFNNTAPTTSVFSVGTSSATNTSGQTYIAYCFAEKTGYSKFGSYVSNNNVDGGFVYTGFKPNWVMVKSIGSGGYNWMIFDSVRQPNNLNGVTLQADVNSAEFDYAPNGYVDLLSNGFKLRSTSNGVNGSGATNYLYMAFGQSLVGSNNVPCTAR